ncbi:463_t:CDS:2 [Acaulospora morrowiae]|uniref:463_t:CDS:1 n=1 Tax=Acaulospora morrowiae TaxID=94023 RepID=A0A9N8W289_9GLOM|nr:463_t:CDS:2 [Acaulospora morrowiae]
MNTEGVEIVEIKCPECKKDISFCFRPTDFRSYYCRPCNSEHFRNEFEFWNSGDLNVDNLIRESQLNANRIQELIEWIDYSNLEEFKHIGDGGFGSVSKAIWKDGPLVHIGFVWSIEKSKWKRVGKTEVALKRLRNSTNLTLDFLNEIRCNLNFNSFGINRLYGITRDPQTKEYIIVSEFKSEFIAKRSLIPTISDFGLCRPANENSVNQSLYGVLPFVAPEVLRGEKFTKAADIYGFGMIMFEIISGEPPFIDREYDVHLALALCGGERPPIPKYAPEPYIKLMNQCWNPIPTNRPTANELYEEFQKWWNEFDQDHVLLQSFTKEREEVWRARLRELEENPRPLMASQNLLTSKFLDYTRQLGRNVVNKIGTSNDAYITRQLDKSFTLELKNFEQNE